MTLTTTTPLLGCTPHSDAGLQTHHTSQSSAYDVSGLLAAFCLRGTSAQRESLRWANPPLVVSKTVAYSYHVCRLLSLACARDSDSCHLRCNIGPAQKPRRPSRGDGLESRTGTGSPASDAQQLVSSTLPGQPTAAGGSISQPAAAASLTGILASGGSLQGCSRHRAQAQTRARLFRGMVGTGEGCT